MKPGSAIWNIDFEQVMVQQFWPRRRLWLALAKFAAYVQLPVVTPY